MNNKVYIGVHQTENMDDGYMGSGKVIKYALAKYGVENFTKVILETFENAKAMYAREKEIVNNDFLRRKDIYNLKYGGEGGFDHINNDEEFRIEKNKKARRIANEKIEKIYGENWRSVIGRLGGAGAHTDEAEKKRITTRKERGIKSDASKMQTEDAKLKKIDTFKQIKHQQGDKNSQFCTMWITDGKKNMKIGKNETIPDGWTKGRRL